MNDKFFHDTAIVDSTAAISINVKIWAWTHIREGVQIGEEVVIGEMVYVGPHVKVGKRSKIQNSAQIYEPAEIGEGVFVGPGVILTNDKYPRSIQNNGDSKGPDDWEKVGVTILTGASIGAGSICVAPVKIGEWAMIGAGSVVTRNVPAFALVAGNPATFIRWVGKSGKPLKRISENNFSCPDTGEIFCLNASGELVPS